MVIRHVNHDNVHWDDQIGAGLFFPTSFSSSFTRSFYHQLSLNVKLSARVALLRGCVCKCMLVYNDRLPPCPTIPTQLNSFPISLILFFSVSTFSWNYFPPIISLGILSNDFECFQFQIFWNRLNFKLNLIWTI